MIARFKHNMLRSDVQPAMQFHALAPVQETVRHKRALHALNVVLLGHQAAELPARDRAAMKTVLDARALLFLARVDFAQACQRALAHTTVVGAVRVGGLRRHITIALRAVGLRRRHD